MKLVQWVWLCMTSFFLISYQSIRFKFFLFTTLKEEEGKPKWENQLRFQWIFTDFRPVISLIATTITTWNFWVGWITNTPKILWRLCHTHGWSMIQEILFDKSHKDVNGLDNWIVGSRISYFPFSSTCGKCKENPLIIIFLGYYRSHKLSSIAINFIDSIWQKLLYYQDVMIFCVAFSVSLRDQTRLVSNPCLLFSGEKRRSVEDFRDWIVCSIALLGEKGRERPICIDGRYSNSSRLADSYSPN